MSRIANTFSQLEQQGRRALIMFVTAGDPEPELTVPLLHTLVESGANILEIGVPFSDPMADGPTIQRASERALKHGMSLRQVLEIVRVFRQKNTSTPVVLMGYANPIEAYGIDAFVRDAREAGVDGVLTVDYPPHECVEFAAQLRANGMDPIFLLAPTSSDRRMQEVSQAGSGFVYYVSLAGVTGAKHLDIDEVLSRLPKIRAATGLPVAVGFGIRDGESARRIATKADAVVIASRLIEAMECVPPAQAEEVARDFVRDIRAAMDKGVGA